MNIVRLCNFFSFGATPDFYFPRTQDCVVTEIPDVEVRG
jgi:hypothetical protein